MVPALSKSFSGLPNQECFMAMPPLALSATQPKKWSRLARVQMGRSKGGWQSTLVSICSGLSDNACGATLFYLGSTDKTSVESPTGVSTGQSPTVGLRLARFNPSSIRCVGKSQPVAADCDQVLDAMPAVINPQIFGEAGWPGVEVGLPVEIHAERKCR